LSNNNSSVFSSTLCHCYYYLAKHKECQELIYEEVSKLQEYSQESLSKCKYLNAVIMKKLRMAPPGVRFDREAKEDYKLGNTGIILPKGTKDIQLKIVTKFDTL